MGAPALYWEGERKRVLASFSAPLARSVPPSIGQERPSTASAGNLDRPPSATHANWSESVLSQIGQTGRQRSAGSKPATASRNQRCEACTVRDRVAKERNPFSVDFEEHADTLRTAALRLLPTEPLGVNLLDLAATASPAGLGHQHQARPQQMDEEYSSHASQSSFHDDEAAVAYLNEKPAPAYPEADDSAYFMIKPASTSKNFDDFAYTSPRHSDSSDSSDGAEQKEINDLLLSSCTLRVQRVWRQKIAARKQAQAEGTTSQGGFSGFGTHKLAGLVEEARKKDLEDRGIDVPSPRPLATQQQPV